MAAFLMRAWWLFVVLALSTTALNRAVVSAADCAKLARPVPDVPTVMAAPDNVNTTAWILYPNCTLDVVNIATDVDGSQKLVCSEKGVARIESLPWGAQRLYLDHNTVKEANFSEYNNLSQVILAQCNLTTVDNFQFPSSLQILDFDQNQLLGIPNGTIPNRVHTLYLNRNGLTSLDNFSLPLSLKVLDLTSNAFTAVNFAIPDGLTELRLTKNPALTAVENLTLPNTLTNLVCKDCNVQTFRGVKLTSQLGSIDFSGSTLKDFEIRESDVNLLKKLSFSGDVDQPTCRDTTANLRLIQVGVPTCVISDAAFDAKYGGGPSNSSTASPSKSPESSSSTIIIVIAVVAAIVCVVVAAVVYRKCIIGKGASDDEIGDKYQEIPATDAQGSTAATAPTGGSSDAPGFAAREYLSNDIRNDERMITYRIAYDEIQVVRVIGRGGFGVIHLAKFRGREVAIKQMLPDKAKDTRVVRSFMDEIRLSASLEHPRIVEFVGLTWSTLQDIAVVNEYMAGGDLRAALDKQQAPDAAQWFETSQGLKAKSAVALDIIVALVYLHSFDPPIIHRDLKARNVLLNADGDAKLSDFGTSREALLDETMTGEIGTVAWIAPEVLRGERYSEKADIYSLGVLLVELDTARHPYRRELSETSATPHSNTRIALLVSSGQLAPSSSETCPSEVATVISSCLSYDPQNRPSAMGVHYEMRKIFRHSK